MDYRCRCCNSELDEEPILIYDNMPQNAQRFPSETELFNERGEKFELHQCQYCGLIQVIGLPVPYYRDVIRSSGVSEEMYKFRVLQFEQFIRKYRLQDKKILEIGAGCGEYMKIFHKVGADVYGIENKEESVNAVRKRGLKINHFFLELEHDKIHGAPYDAFYIMNFLEHIPQPNDFIKGIFNNLKEGAVGIIEVPNVNMLLEKKLYSEFIKDHLMYFTKESLKMIIEKNGFEVVECKEIWYDYIISAIVKKRKKYDLSALYQKRTEISEMIVSYLEQKNTQGKRVAVWGAGHQALAVLALSDINDKIECVIDSAPFKQQKFTPATHIPIVAPEILKENKIGAVLIMAAGYSDEVARIMKKRYSGIDIAILRDYGIEIVD